MSTTRPRLTTLTTATYLTMDTFAVPLFYCLLVPSITIGNYQMAKQLGLKPTSTEQDREFYQTNMIAGFFLCNYLYSFLSTAPRGLTQFCEYVRIITSGKVDRTSDLLSDSELFNKATENPKKALRIFIAANIFVLVTQTCIFELLGAAGARDSVSRITHSKTPISGAAALGLGLGSSLTNHILYVYAFTLLALKFSAKNFNSISSKKLSWWLSAPIRGASLIYASSYVKSGLENTRFEPLQYPLNEINSNRWYDVSYRLLLWCSEMVLLSSLEDPVYRFQSDLSKAPSTIKKAILTIYKLGLVTATVLPLTSTTPFYSLFLIAFLASKPLEDRLLNAISPRDNFSMSVRLLDKDSDEMQEATTDPMLQGTQGTTRGDNSEILLGQFSRVCVGLCLLSATLSALSCIALTNPTLIKPCDGNTTECAPPFFEKAAKFTSDIDAAGVITIGMTGVLTNMLGISNIIQLLIGIMVGKNNGRSPQEERRLNQGANAIATGLKPNTGTMA